MKSQNLHSAYLLSVMMSLSVVAAANATDLVWIGGTGLWNAAANWSPAQLPTAADNVFITNNTTYTVTIPNAVDPTVASLTLGGGSGVQTLSLGRSILTLNGASAVNSNGVLVLTVGNSTVTGGATLTVNGTLNWASGTMSGAGTTSIGSSGNLIINGGVTLTTRTLNNSGHVSWDSGNFTASTGAVINNLAGGIFDVTFDGRINVATAPATFNNSGLFRKTAGATIANIAPAFNNSGTVQSQSGTLSLDGGGTHTGIFSNAPGATATFGGGAHLLTASSFVTGAGTLVSGGGGGGGGGTTLTANGIFDVGSTFNVGGGVATLAAGCNVANATVGVSGGILNFNTASLVSVMNVSAGTLGGTSPVTVTGPLTLSGGTITNAIVTANGGLNITGGFTLNGGKLINPATAIWSAGNFTGANGAVFSNLFGATLINTFDGNAPTGAGATPTFVNAGLFQKTGGTAALGNTSIDFQFINTGTVEVQTNSMRYNINQQTAGLTLLNGGDGITAQAQPIQLLGGSLVGTGLVTVANVQNVINSATISPGLPLGRLDIAGNYQQTAAGKLNIELGGYVAGSTYDLVTVTGGGAGGVAALGGTLNLSITNGFSPTNGATFTFLTALSRVGAFATFNYPSNDIGLTVSYDLTSAKVTVSNMKPVVSNPIVDPAAVTYGAAFNFQFPANTFTDPDNNPLTYTAAGLPPGLTFVGATRTFSGNPTQTGVFAVSVAANDGGTPSLTVTNTFFITVSPATLSIAADAQIKTYGAADPELTFIVSGLQFSDTPASVLTGALARAAGEAVAGSPYAITQGTLAADSNYTINFTGSSLSVTKAALSVTADAKSKIYGATDPAFTVTYSDFVNSETPAALGGTLSFTRAPGENVGSYLTTPGGLTSGNYTITFNTGLLTITKAALSITADAKTKIYGATDPAFTATYSGFVLGETSATLGGTLTFTRASGTNVGSYLITPSGQTSGNYTIAFNTGLLSITKATLSVTADAKTKIYGATDPAFTATYSGFVLGETPAVLGGALAFSRAPGTNVGSYLITPSGQTSGNYTITFNTDLLAITKATLTVTADAKTKVYGAADPAFTATYAGFVPGETPAALSGTLAFTRALGENVASYLITPSGLTSGNYTITFNTSSLAITKAVLSVTAAAKTKIYGGADPALTFTTTGLQFSDTVATVLTGALARTAGETVAGSPYAITQGTLLPNGNYTISFTGSTLTINRAALSITADAKTKIYGAADPANTVTYAGFVLGETSAALGGTLSFTRAPGENVGSYVITPSGQTSGNYTITFNTASLSITKAVLSVAANATSKTYGAADPALTFTTTGLQFSDSAATVLTGVLTRVGGETVAGGPYTITQGTLTPNGNYTVSFTGNNFSITKAALSVTADTKTKIYGATDPVFTATYAGFVLGETPAVLGGTLALTRAPGESVGSYVITPSGQTSGNYTVTFNTGFLSITKSPLSVTADAKTKIYGTTDPAFTVTYAGFVNSETPAVLNGTLAFIRASGENVGSYLITQSGLTSGNYTITFNTGSLSIVAPAPTILSLTRVGASNVLITWTAAINANYHVQYKTALTGATWLDLAGDVTATGATASKTDIWTTTNRFYRVQVLP